MEHGPKKRASLEEVLASTSDALFPAEMGRRRVDVHSRDCEGDTALHVMVWRGDRYAVRLLIDSGADVNAQGDMGETPLHIAVRRGDPEIVEALLAAGAKTNLRSEFNETAAEQAQKKGGDLARLFRG